MKALETCVLVGGGGAAPADPKARAIPADDGGHREHQADPKPKKKSILAQFGRDLNHLASDGKLAQRIVQGKVPEVLKSSRMIELSLSILVAGTKYRGEFEERMQAVIKEASADEQVSVILSEGKLSFRRVG